MRHLYPVMKHIPENIRHIIRKFFDGSVTPSEKALLDEWYHSYNSVREVEVISEENEVEIDSRLKNRLQQFLLDQNPERHAPRLTKRIIWSSAAAVFLAIVSFLYFTNFRSGAKHEEVPGIQETAGGEILPGGDKAILTLADGTTMVLDSAFQGVIDLQGNAAVEKIGDGLIRYTHNNYLLKNEIVYNTIATPRGGQYQLELSDRTKVWLNAASSIRFPTEFRDGIREVEITGEAYFEVFHDPGKRFTVKVNGLNADVFGTSFNIKAYDNEQSITTTLLSGSLRVTNNNTVSQLLVPGDKLAYMEHGEITIEKNSDVEEAVAWKNGKFIFNNTPLRTIMKQTERWYDVDVVFEEDKTVHFTGELSRSVGIEELLRKLELTNEVRFKIEKKTITVLR